MIFNPVVFREYDVRGVYEKEFDLGFAENLARAYVRFYYQQHGKANPTVSLGYDARASSLPIIKALTKGFLSSGANVIQLGQITSPISYFSTFTMTNVDGAIMVTGSHNPPEYNGFKISVGKRTISGHEILALKEIMEKKDYLQGQGQESSHDIFPSYLQRYKEEFKDLSGIKVIVDCGNGAAGCIVRKMYEQLGLKPVILYEQPDGSFPNHHPDPTIEKYMEVLKQKVIDEKADLGIGFDGDADRIGIIDNQGRFLLGDDIMSVFARSVLAKHPGASIVGDVKCSDRYYQDIAAHGGKPIMWKTGHSLIKEKVKAEKAPFGGELSCHIFFNDRNYGYDDALYAGLRMIEIIRDSKKSLSQHLADYPVAFNTPEIRIDTTEEKKVKIVDHLIKKFASVKTDEYQVNLIDGIRISFTNGWALARASNTQPVLSLRFEANSESNLQKIRSMIEGEIKGLL